MAPSDQKHVGEPGGRLLVRSTPVNLEDDSWVLITSTPVSREGAFQSEPRRCAGSATSNQKEVSEPGERLLIRSMPVS